MFRSRARLGGVVAGAAALLTAAAVATANDDGDDRDHGDRGDRNRGGYEVWTMDQTDTRPGYGGTLHIFDGSELKGAEAANATPESVDLGGEASDLCREKTGVNPTRPHMVVFNGAESDDDATDAAIAFVVSGHVLFMDTETREPLDCIRMSPGEGGRIQAHAAWPTPDQKHLLVANQNGKLLQRIKTDYRRDRFELEPEATLSLYEGTTPNGAPKQDAELRPDNAPICPRTTEDGKVTFASLRGGGAFVVNHKATPMGIVAEYDRNQVDDNGCGQFEARGKMFVNAGAGTTIPPVPGDEPDGHDVYSFDLDEFDRRPNPPNTPAAKLVYSRDAEGDVDAHAVANSTKQRRYLWWGDRSQNDVTVMDTRREEVVNQFELSEPFATDPAPDLFDLAPNGKYMLVSQRGPSPLSGGHDAIGNTPGVGVVDIRRDGRDGKLVGVAPVPPGALGLAPDPHGIRVRETGRR